MNIFFASDHHLFHSKIIEYSRPQFKNLNEHNQFILDRHNSVVSAEDIIYFLGDVCLSTSKKEDYDILHKFNGRKRLIIGNHDTPERIKVYNEYFEKIYGYHTIGNRNSRDSDIIISHIPVHARQLDSRFTKNIHGHLHNDVVRDHMGCIDSRYVCVSMEQISYTPISLDQIR